MHKEYGWKLSRRFQPTYKELKLASQKKEIVKLYKFSAYL